LRIRPAPHGQVTRDLLLKSQSNSVVRGHTETAMK
jgi:hypothetical protein